MHTDASEIEALNYTDSPPQSSAEQHDADTCAQLHTLRSALLAVDPARFLRGTKAWIYDGFAAPLLSLIEQVQEALARLDELAGDDDELGGLCFIGGAEAAEACRMLNREGLQREELLIGAESARERVVRVLDAVLDHRGYQVALDPSTEGRNASSVRAMYATLNEEVTAAQESADVKALTRALTDAMSNDAWAIVRMSDRFVVEHLRRRAIAWHGPEATPKAAERLLSDAAASMTLLRGINLRPALIAHDLHAARQALELLEPSRTSSQAREAMVKALQALHGRDNGLDELSAAFARGSAVGWRVKAALKALVEQLEAPAAGSDGF